MTVFYVAGGIGVLAVWFWVWCLCRAASRADEWARHFYGRKGGKG